MSRSTAAPRTLLVTFAALGLLLGLLVVAPVSRADVSDTISVVKAGETLDNAEIVARLAEATFDGPTTRVLIGREDLFADNIASAVMQDDSPLLLVPSNGPITDRVADLLERYDPDEVVLLGGEAALGPEVESALAANYSVTRRSGSTRFETAIDIALQEAPAADTAIMARAFAAEGTADESQAFADALAAGGWAADNGWPILLTQTETIPRTVETYLMGSSIRNVMIMGGTAAVSAGVETRLGELGVTTMRIAGPDRFSTALQVASERGVDNATDANRIVLVEGQDENAWAGGFAAAAHSAVFDAPIVLANGTGLPDSTESFLTPPAGFAQAGFFENAVLTCATLPVTCETARVTRGLPPEADVVFDPPSGSLVDGGSVVRITVTGEGPLPHELSGDCIPDTSGTAPGTATVTLDPGFDGECTITSQLTLADGSVQIDTATYTVTASAGGILTGVVNGEQYSYVPGDTEEVVLVGPDDTFSIDGQPATSQVFFQNATIGDVVVPTAAFAGTAAPQNHALTNRAEDFYTSGVVGNVDLLGGMAAIIEPVSGIVLRAFTFDLALYTVDGAPAPLAGFQEDISEGDQVVLGQDAAENPTIALTNDAIAGPVTQLMGVNTLNFRIDSGGLEDSPLIGDDPVGDQDLDFNVVNDPSFDLLVDGESATFAEFRDAINDGDDVTYSRQGDEERFELTNAAAMGITGLATETFDFFTVPSITILRADGRSAQEIESDAAFVVNGLVSVRDDFIDAYTAGDGIVITPATNNSVQRIELTNQTLSGSLDDVQSGTTNRFDVVRTNGIVHNNLNYQSGNLFGNDKDNRYFVDGTEVTPMQFETAVNAADTDVASIVVDPDLSALVNELRLSTGT